MLQDNFGNLINIKPIKRTSNVLKFTLLLALMFFLLEAFLWLSIAQRLPLQAYTIVRYLFLPISIFTGILLLTISWYIHLKSVKFLLNGITEKDPLLFNKGFSLMFNAHLLTFFTLALCIIGGILEILIN